MCSVTCNLLRKNIAFISLLTISLSISINAMGVCNCNWNQWRAWSECSETCGGGQRVRSRAFWYNAKFPECFTICDRSGIGIIRDFTCNAICYHGSFLEGICNCETGWKGKCCNDRMYFVLNCLQNIQLFNFFYLDKLLSSSNHNLYYDALQHMTYNLALFYVLST